MEKLIKKHFVLSILIVCLFSVCNKSGKASLNKLLPRVVSQKVAHDSDDPAIWIHPNDPSLSLILGTDKHTHGALYAFDLDGKIIHITDTLRYPNNVDVEYGFDLNGMSIDIAVCTERERNMIRVFRLPDLTPIDDGGIPVFEDHALRAPMGIALYRRPSDSAVFAIVSRKRGPADGYLYQYRIWADENGVVRGEKVRAFGIWDQGEDIEAIAVDDSMGTVYYSSESAGILKYYADPDHPNADSLLSHFGRTEFADDREGISIYAESDTTGYIIVSDQGADRFHIYCRAGAVENRHVHILLKTVYLSTHESDGSDVTTHDFNNRFPGGLLVAMSTDKTFHYYAWTDLISSL